MTEIKTADVVAVTRGPNRRVLLIERGWDPFAGHWALPGGHVDEDDYPADAADDGLAEEITLRVAAARELGEETGVDVPAADLHWVGQWDTPGRDPRGPYVTTAYLAVVPAGTEATAGDDARTARWWPVDALPKQLAFDHEEILRTALRLVR